ncbi:hypothetical protein MRX96_049369 [Rhipicephalus microplus]
MRPTRQQPVDVPRWLQIDLMNSKAEAGRRCAEQADAAHATGIRAFGGLLSNEYSHSSARLKSEHYKCRRHGQGTSRGEELFVACAYAHVLTAVASKKKIIKETTVSGHAAKRGIKECSTVGRSRLASQTRSLPAWSRRAGLREESVRSRSTASPNVVVAVRRALCRRRRLQLAKL